jgi:biopolymer transport protein ExbD
VTVELKSSKEYLVKLSGKANASYTVQTKEGVWNRDGLTEKLKEVKGRFPDASAVTISAENSVQYQDVIQAMEAARKQLPAVMLGGF